MSLSLFRLPQESAQFFYQEIREILFDEHAAQSTQILMLRNILREILQAVTADEPQLFTDLYSRLLFVADKYALPAYILRELHAFRRIATRAGRKNSKLTVEAAHSSARALALIIFFFSEERAPEPLRTALLTAKPFTKEAATTKEIVPLLRLTVQGFGIVESKQGRAFVDIEGLSHEGETLLVRLWEPWHDMERLGWEFCTLHIAHVRFVGTQKAASVAAASVQTASAESETTETAEISLYETTAQSIVILEPDYLLDVTDLAECVQGKLPHGGNPRLSLLRKFLPTEAKMSLVGGNIANFCFDALLSNPDADFDTVFREAILQKPLQIIALQNENAESLNLLRMHASTIFANIRTMLSSLSWDKASIEASFMSPMYGLQGRLDLMVEYADDPQRKTIVELKSGSAPANATWENHAAQVTGYNLLLDSCFRERSGDSCIFYARDIVRPLRNIPNDQHSKQLLLALRNRIIAQEHSLSLRHPRTLQELHPEHFGLMPRFVEAELQRFANVFAAATSLERKYFRSFAAFVSRENWSARIGGGERGEGFSGLWRRSLVEKADSYSVLAYLALDKEESDFAQLHLHFRRTPETSPLANFRVGDIVMLYPLFEHEADERSFLRGAMLKGYIKRITRESVVVSLRNKQITTDGRAENLFRSEVQWAIEPDFMGTEFKSQYESLYELLKATESKRNLLMGLQEPKFDEEVRQRVQNTPYNDLTEEQHARLAEAMSAHDYFLLQGPPGTGKTSRMLKSMALHLFNHTQENVLFLAFTNRAVDEICEALKNADLDFMRLGAKESTAHTDRVLYTLIEGKTIEEIQELLAGKRIVVSTISSLLKNQEILAIIHFSTLIVDEASQVVEPQIIGLLARFRRFVLIGDEKQLPAVVVQPERGAFVKDAEMNDAGFLDLRTSVFERLLTRCKAQGWSHGFGIITRQGRMHRAISAFPNAAFYDGALAHLGERQAEPLSEMTTMTDVHAHYSEQFPELHCVENKLSQKRLVFWASQKEDQTKVHEQEARRAAMLAAYFHEQLGERFHAGSIGIITPFRAQIAAIHRHLPSELHGSITIDTVERYQGSERDIIILSFAVNFPSQVRSIQSLSLDGSIDRKLNVALTRARERMIALGCTEALAQSPILNRFIGFVRNEGGFVSNT